MEGEFEQIIMKLLVSIKENNKSKSKCQWLLFGISYKFKERNFNPYKHCNFTGINQWHYHRARVWLRSVSFSTETVNAVTED